MNKDDIFIKNKNLNLYELNKKKIILKSKSVSLFVVLTRLCNLNCIMCPRVNFQKNTLSFDVIKQLFTMFPYLSEIEWQGGEVFMLDYFRDLLLETAKYTQIKQHITTNGLLIDRKWAEILVRNKINLGYSIDTVVKQSYENIRRGAKFERVIKSLEIINEYNNKYNNPIKLDLYTVVMQQNYKEIHLLPEFAKKYGFKEISFDLVIPFNNISKKVLFHNKKEVTKYLKKTIPLIKDKCIEFKIGFKCSFKNVLSDTQTLSNFATSSLNINTLTDTDSKNKRLKKGCCIFPWTNFMGEVNGKAHSNCTCDYRYSIGDLYKTNWENIWNGKEIRLYRKYIKENQAYKICDSQCQFY